MTVRAAAVYARISSDQDGRGLGVARQVEDCRKLAAPLANSPPPSPSPLTRPTNSTATYRPAAHPDEELRRPFRPARVMLLVQVKTPARWLSLERAM
jgi:hypothetical protein